MQIKDRNKSRRSIGLIALVCLLCHLMVAPNVAIASAHPNFAFVFAALIAMSVGGRVGVACGFAAGLVYDLTATSPFGLMAFLLTIASFALGIEVHDRIADDPVITIIPVSLVALAVSLCYHFAMLLMGLDASLVSILFLRSLPSALLTIIAYALFALAMGRHRGSKGTSLGKNVGGSHYALPKR